MQIKTTHVPNSNKEKAFTAEIELSSVTADATRVREMCKILKLVRIVYVYVLYVRNYTRRRYPLQNPVLHICMPTIIDGYLRCSGDFFLCTHELNSKVFSPC